MLRYFLLIAALIVAAVGYTIYWHEVADHLMHDTGAWIAAEKAQGYDITTGGYHVTGFPSTIVLTVQTPRVEKPADPRDWSFAAPRLTLYVQPWNFHHVILDFGTDQALGWRENGTAHRAQLHEADAKASLLLGTIQEGIEAADLALGEVTLSLPDLTGPVRAARLEVHARQNHGESAKRPQGSLDLALSAANLVLPSPPALPLGQTFAALSLDATLPPPLPKDLSAPALAAWRDDGGVVQVEHLALDWGALDLQASGTLALDKEMRPLAAFAAQVQGFGPALDAAAAAGAIKPGNAALAKALLGALAKPDATGKKSLSVPITAEHGALFVGPVKLFTLSPLPLLSGQSPAG